MIHSLLDDDTPVDTTILSCYDTRDTILDGATLPLHTRVIRFIHTDIHTVRNLDRLINLTELDLSSCDVKVFDCRLPPSLDSLTLRNCVALHTLRSLERSNLRFLDLSGCKSLRTLPNLPPSLLCMVLTDSAVESVPFLHDGMWDLQPRRLFAEGNSRLPPNFHTAEFRRQQRETMRRERFAQLKEELMIHAWHPRRVEGWLVHGESVLDMMLGV